MMDLVKTYFRWWKTWRSLPVWSWLKGADCYRRGEFEKAEVLYRTGLSSNPQHRAAFTARLDYAYCLFKNRKFIEAEGALKQAVLERPGSREACLRLARLQLWIGQPMEAAWTMRRLLQEAAPDPEVVATFLTAVVENGGPSYLIKEATTAAAKVEPASAANQAFEVALARYDLFLGNIEAAKRRLSDLATVERAPFDAVLCFAELLLQGDDIVPARHHLRRALAVAPAHPRVLSLLAQSYLKAGVFYNPEYAVQLALNACQSTGWLSPREMHVLAEAYLLIGDKMAALLIASKAKDVGSKLLGSYRELQVLDRMIETLSTGTQA